MASNPYNQPSAVQSSGSRTYSKKDVKAGRINPYDDFGATTRDNAIAEQKSTRDSQAKKREKQLAEQLVKEQKQAKQPKQPKQQDNDIVKGIKTVGKIAGDINKAVYGSTTSFVDENIVKPTVKHLKTTGEVVDAAVGTDNETLKMINARKRFLDEDFKAGKISKEKYTAGLKKVQESHKKLGDKIANSNLMKQDRTETAADVAGLVLDVGVPGLGSKAVSKGAAVGTNVAGKTGLKVAKDGVAKGAVKKIAKKATSDEVVGGAAYGGAYGAQQQAEQKGDKVTVDDLAVGITNGAPAGAVLGGALPILGRGLSNLLSRSPEPVNLPKGIARPEEIVGLPKPTAAPGKGAVKPLAAKKTDPAAHLADERAHRSGTKPFTDIDPLTAQSVTKLEKRAMNKPVPTGHTRLFQMNDGKLKSDQYFTDIDKLANFANNRSDNATMRFVDVPNNKVIQAPGKPDVFRISNEPIAPVAAGSRKLSKTAEEYAHTSTPDEIINDTADYWHKHGKDTKGGQLIDKTQATDPYGAEGGKTRISEHNQFYSDFYKENKRAPKLADYKAEIQRQLDAGGGSMVEKEMADAYALAKTRKTEADALRQAEGEPELVPATPGTKIRPLASLDKKPELGTSKLAASVKSEAVRKKLITKTKAEAIDLPTYNKADLKDQAKYATDLLEKDPQRAIDIALGKDEPPAHILPQMVFNAVEEYAKTLGGTRGGELMQQLAMSRRVTDLSTMGQNIRAAGERDPHSVVNMLNDVVHTRSKVAEKRLKGKSIAKVEAADRKAVKAATPKVDKYDWETFVKEIKC